MEPTQIVLIRHGQTQWNWEGRIQGHLDSPLTETGLSQAKSLAKRMKSEKFAAIYSSDLGRARQTASCIAEKKGQPVLIDPRLRERHLGIFQGHLKKELKIKFPDEFEHYHTHHANYAIPEGESPKQFSDRCIECFEQLAEKYPGEQILIVAHGGVLNNLLKYTLGIPIEAPRHFLSINTAINIFSYQADHHTWMLELWGDTYHLRKLESEDFFEDE